jgi:hypothetical protein
MVEEETQKGGGGPQQYTRSYGEEDTQMRLWDISIFQTGREC